MDPNTSNVISLKNYFSSLNLALKITLDYFSKQSWWSKPVEVVFVGARVQGKGACGLWTLYQAKHDCQAVIRVKSDAEHCVSFVKHSLHSKRMQLTFSKESFNKFQKKESQHLTKFIQNDINTYITK